MSAEVKSYRWSDKPVAAKQSIALVLISLLIVFLGVRFRAKFKTGSNVHAFTQGRTDQSKGKTAQEIAKSGSVPAGGINKASHFQVRGSTQASAQHQNAIQERPLFDGMTATLEVATLQSLSSNSGDASAEVTVIGIIPGDVSPADAEGVTGATLHGQFQSNYDTKRMQILFRELVTPDGRHYPVTGVAMDMEGQSVGVPADYSSGMGLRILGATIGTVITTAETVETSRIIENGAGQDALLGSQLNQAIATSSQGASSTISDEATHDLKNHKAELSLPPGTHFQVKVRPTPGARTGDSS
jgi:hypothetical protein